MTRKLLKNYGALLTEIKARVRSAQYAALKAVNKELIGLYWDIGRIITGRGRRRRPRVAFYSNSVFTQSR